MRYSNFFCTCALLAEYVDLVCLLYRLCSSSKLQLDDTSFLSCLFYFSFRSNCLYAFIVVTERKDYASNDM